MDKDTAKELKTNPFKMENKMEKEEVIIQKIIDTTTKNTVASELFDKLNNEFEKLLNKTNNPIQAWVRNNVLTKLGYTDIAMLFQAKAKELGYIVESVSVNESIDISNATNYIMGVMNPAEFEKYLNENNINFTFAKNIFLFDNKENYIEAFKNIKGYGRGGFMNINSTIKTQENMENNIDIDQDRTAEIYSELKNDVIASNYTTYDEYYMACQNMCFTKYGYHPTDLNTFCEENYNGQVQNEALSLSADNTLIYKALINKYKLSDVLESQLLSVINNYDKGIAQNEFGEEDFNVTINAISAIVNDTYSNVERLVKSSFKNENVSTNLNDLNPDDVHLHNVITAKYPLSEVLDNQLLQIIKTYTDTDTTINKEDHEAFINAYEEFISAVAALVGDTYEKIEDLIMSNKKTNENVQETNDSNMNLQTDLNNFWIKPENENKKIFFITTDEDEAQPGVKCYCIGSQTLSNFKNDGYWEIEESLIKDKKEALDMLNDMIAEDPINNIHIKTDTELFERKLNENHKQQFEYAPNEETKWNIFEEENLPQFEKPKYNPVALRQLISDDAFLVFSMHNLSVGNEEKDLDLIYNTYIRDDEYMMKKLATYESYMYKLLENAIKKDLMTDIILKMLTELNLDIITNKDEINQGINTFSKMLKVYVNEIKQSYALATNDVKDELKTIFKTMTLLEIILKFKECKFTYKELQSIKFSTEKLMLVFGLSKSAVALLIEMIDYLMIDMNSLMYMDKSIITALYGIGLGIMILSTIGINYTA